jgi:transketolase
MVGSHAGASTGANGKSHASLADVAIITAMGGIEVWAPGDELDARGAVMSLVAEPRAAYIRTSREPCGMLPLPAGLLRHNNRKGELIVCSTGIASQWTLEVVRVMAEQGVALPWVHIPQRLAVTSWRYCDRVILPRK